MLALGLSVSHCRELDFINLPDEFRCSVTLINGFTLFKPEQLRFIRQQVSNTLTEATAVCGGVILLCGGTVQLVV